MLWILVQSFTDYFLVSVFELYSYVIVNPATQVQEEWRLSDN